MDLNHEFNASREVEVSLDKARNHVFFNRMKLNLNEDVVSLTDFARNTKRHAEELSRGERMRILTQNGKASVVVLSLEAFDKLSRDAEEYRMDLRLREAVEKYAAGERGAKAGTVIGKLRKRAAKRRATQ
jgi:PHD/YefM family antitoxin component YafN of YafNO toxin-antitoxin module